MKHTPTLSQLQAESDAFDDAFGLPRTDLAYASAIEREKARVAKASRRTWAEQKAAFKEQLALRDYTRAIGA